MGDKKINITVEVEDEKERKEEDKNTDNRQVLTEDMPLH